jgi:hypothetical protein
VEDCTYFWGVNTSWGINTAESKRPINQEDNRAPQPTISHLEIDLNNSTAIVYVGDALAKLYEKPSASNKVFLMKRLFNMKMSEGGSVANHLNEFNTITNQLSSVKVDFDDEVRALLILCSLPESWNGLVMAISNSVSGSNTLKFDDVVGVILSEEM